MRRTLVSNKDYPFGDAVTSRAIGGAWIERVSVVEAATDCVALYDLNAHCCSDAALSRNDGLICFASLEVVTGVGDDRCVQGVDMSLGFVVVYIVYVFTCQVAGRDVLVESAGCPASDMRT
jgi:hypothetical protein